MTLSASCIAIAQLILTLPQHDVPEQPHIVIDAEFEEWMSVPAAVVDPLESPSAFVDFGEVRAAHDERFIHLLIDFGKTVNIQGLEGTAMIVLDSDGDPKTGRTEHGLDGVDLIVDLTPANARSYDKVGVGIGVRSTTYSPDPSDATAKKITPYDIGMISAPTHASRRFEFRFERGSTLPQTPPAFAGTSFRAKLVHLNSGGTLQDETDVFTFELTESAKPASGMDDQPNDPFQRDQHADVRLLSWNIARGALLTKSEPFARTLAAIKPDVILLQELLDETTAEQVHHFVTQVLPLNNGERWSVLVGAGGGDLRCGIASRFPLEEIESLKIISMPHQPDRSVRATCAVIEHQGRRLLAASIHLKCCGKAGGPEDAQREQEVQSISDAIKAAYAHERIDAVYIAGDYNLVGSRDPLETLATGLDTDRSSLAVVDAEQLDGLSNATWLDPKQPFVPGRLDYALYSESALKVVRSFVFESCDLSSHWMQHHQLQATDTEAASDHLPVIADVQWLAAENAPAKN